MSGGNVERLVNVARADTVNLAVHLGVDPGEHAQGGRRRRVRFNIPPRLVVFTGRDAELAALKRALGVTDEVVITQAVTGLGGVGKSQLAARYVHTHAEGYDVVAWVAAEDDATADLSALAAELGEPVGGLTPAERADRALHWFNHAPERWLLVLDNITDPGQLRRCCPHSGNGRVLITSRNHGLRQHAALLAVDVFDEDTATSYLLEQTDRHDDHAAARRLAAALGCLPLALSHAAAYCQTGTTFTEYLAMLSDLPASIVFDSSPRTFYAQTVASTWRPSIAAATNTAPLAERVLAIAAHLAPDAIPKALFTGLLDDADDPTHARRLSDAFNALHRYSLITAQDSTFSVHRLIQKTVRDSTSPGEPIAALRALDALDDAFPAYRAAQQPQQWPQCERLVAHVLTLPDTFTAPLDSAPKMLTLLDRACYYLRLSGSNQRAVTTAESNVAHAAALLGSNHEATLTARANLAGSYYQAGRTSDAIEFGERVLTDRERILGPEHPNTLSARANLAGSYRQAGRTSDAIELEERVLTDSERILGPEHPNTLTARANLAAMTAGGDAA